MTELGLTSYAYYWASSQGVAPANPWRKTAIDLVRRTAGLGLQVLEICENVASFDPADRMQVVEVRRAAEEAGIRLQLGCRAMTIDGLHAAVAQAHVLGSTILRVVPWAGDARPDANARATLQTTLAAVLPVCARYRIQLAVENYFDLGDSELADTVRQLDTEWVGVTLDTANSVGRLSDPVATANQLAKHVLSVHLKDFEVTKPPIGYRVIGTPLGDGQLDVMAVLRAITAAGRQPPLLLELWVDPESDLDSTLQKEDDWVERSVAYARRELSAALQPAHS